ncbi:MAG: hypothetical protein CMP59_08440 [Flavobacteriales bacterium]|nr:hypothetical protein [Flavobacteriales bacterium]|tara:strand:+ start:1065 stop:1994 length:930 start_codon:yes stop_codon:yes gene_type:complete
MKKSKTSAILSAVILASALSACVSEEGSESARNRQKKKEVELIDMTDSEKKEKIEKVQKVFYTLPSPLELSLLFKSEGIQYIPSVMHNLTERDRYLLSKKKALNLGVYGADLSYAGLFSKHEDAIAYLKVCQVIGDEIGIGETFEQELISRLEKSPNSRDTLLQVISDFFLNNQEFLRNSEQQNISTYVIAGGWVEALYLGSFMTDENSDAEGVKNIVASQKFSLENLIELLNSTEDKGSFNNINQHLQELYDLYAKVIYPEFLQSPEAFKDSDFIYYDTSQGKIEITQATFLKIKLKVKEIRDIIVSY